MLRIQREQRGKTTVLRLSGNLDVTTAPQLKDDVLALVESNVRSMVVDLDAVRLLDSSGVGVLVLLFKRLREKQGKVCFSGLQSQPKEVFRLLRLDVTLDVSLSTDAALEKLGQG